MKLNHTPFGLSISSQSGEHILIRHVIGVGQNYAAHAAEQGKAPPTHPMLFTKNPRALCMDGENIVVPRICQEPVQVDFEAELGVVVGTRRDGAFVRDVSVTEALSCVLGYVAANDVSARWWQKEGSGGQFNRGKSFDTFCPISAVAPADQVKNPQDVRVTCELNGTLMQDARTSDMIFSLATLIHEMSRGTTLLPGTLILTGTPSGVGFTRKPPVFLRHGDTVRVTVEGVGSVTNRVVYEGATG
jgi:2-keto-4-pentenoate hydratase/2-oxohepta-3-ene-1,7-dioic acid hydratase in catechol pathway